MQIIPKGIIIKPKIKKINDCISKYNNKIDIEKSNNVSKKLTNVYKYKCLEFNLYFKYFKNNDGFVGFYDRQNKNFIMMVSITTFKNNIANYLKYHLKPIVYSMLNDKKYNIDKKMVETIWNIITNFKTSHLAIDEAFNLYDKTNNAKKFFKEKYNVKNINEAKKFLLGKLYYIINRYYIVRWGTNFSLKQIYNEYISGEFLYLITEDKYFLNFKTIYLYPLNTKIKNSDRNINDKKNDIENNTKIDYNGNKYGKNKFFNRS